jgi:hypothetical protein
MNPHLPPWLSLLAPSGARRAITQLTLVTGFSSTLFWPVIHFLDDRFGWQTTYLLGSAAILFVCFPFNLTLSARRSDLDPAAHLPETARSKAAGHRTMAFLLP